MRQIAIALAVPLLIAACSGNSDTNNASEALEEAAEVSDPAAAEVLENAADNGMDPQNALEAAGNAQAATVSQRPRARQSNAAAPPPPAPRPPAPKPPAEPAAPEADEHAGHNEH